MAKKIYFRYFIIWITLSTGFFFASEQITNWLFPGIHQGEHWLIVTSSGLGLILVLTILFLIISVYRRPKS